MKKGQKRRATPEPAAPVDRSAQVAAFALGVVLVGTPLLVDTGAESAFDAPKRLLALAGTAVAAGALFAWPRAGDGGAPTRAPRRGAARFLIGLFIAVLSLALLSAALSPRRAAALDAFRTLALYALLVPIAASPRLDARWPALLQASLAGWIVNAAASILQAAGALRLFAVESLGGRQDTGAFVGNEGYLALMTVVAAVACLTLLLVHRRPGHARFVLPALALFLAAAAVDRSLTALLALAGGAAVVLLVRFRGRALTVTAALAALLAASALAVPALRQRVAWASADVRLGHWNAVLSYRLGAWAAALEMARERPLLGWGPGTFAAEFIPHRLRAEIRHQQRLASPSSAGSYGEAHSDYLQGLAEGGAPATVAAITALGVLLVGLWRRARGPRSAEQAEAALLAALLATFAVAALTWFPLQRAISAAPLLLALGRGYRIVSGAEADS